MMSAKLKSLDDSQSGEQSNQTAFEFNSGLFRAGWVGMGQDLTHGVRQRQMALVNDQLPISLFISTSIGTSLIMYSAITFRVEALYLWGLLLVCLTGLSIRDFSHKRVSPHPPSHRSKKRLWRGVSRVSLMGLLWGSLALILPSADQNLQLTIIFALAGAGASGAILLCAIPLMAALFIVLTMAPAAIFMLMSPSLAGVFWMWILFTLALTQLSILLQVSILELIRAEELIQQNERFGVENTFAKAIDEAESINAASNLCISILGGYLGWTFGRVLTRSVRAEQDVFLAAGIWSRAELNSVTEWFAEEEQLTISASEGLLGRALYSTETQYVRLSDTGGSVSKKSHREQALSNAHVKRGLIIPVLVRGSVDLIVELYDDRADEFDDSISILASTLSLQLGRAIERRNVQEQRQFLLKVLDSVDDEIIACDADGLLYYNNDPQTLEQGGIDPVPSDQWPNYFNLFHSDGKNRMTLDEIPLYRALQGEQIEQIEMVTETNSGTQRFIVSGGPMLSSQGDLMGAVVSMHNISDTRRLQNQLLHAHKMEAVGQLTGGVAHDFNNVLMIAHGNLELLGTSYPPEGEAAELLGEALDAIGKANKVTKQLLAVSRSQLLQPGIIDINFCITELVSMLSRTLGAGVELYTKKAEYLWKVKVDAAQLESAVLNLALNAKDAMEGEGQLTIETDNVVLTDQISRGIDLPSGEYVTVCMKDTGAGISPAQLSRIFEPFFTTKELTGGTGLGLSMAHGFLRQSGGNLVAASELAKGSIFTLYLPRAVEEDIDTRPKAKKLDVKPSTMGDQVLQKQTILVVEDEPALLKFVCVALEREGFITLRAKNAQEATHLVGINDHIAMILSDIMMRGSDNGFELAETILQSHPEMPFLFMSGYADAASLRSREELGSMNIVHKPFGIQTLVEEVRKTLLVGASGSA